MSDETPKGPVTRDSTGPSLAELEEQLASIREKITAAESDELRDDLEVLETYFFQRVAALKAEATPEVLPAPKTLPVFRSMEDGEGIQPAVEPNEAPRPQGWLLALRWSLELGWVRSLFDLTIERVHPHKR